MELLRALVEGVPPRALQALVAEYGNLPDGAQETDVSWDHPKSWAGLLEQPRKSVELYGPDDRRDPNLEDLVFEPTAGVVDVLIWPSVSPDDHRRADRRGAGSIGGALCASCGCGCRGNRSPGPTEPSCELQSMKRTLEHLLDHPDVERVRAAPPGGGEPGTTEQGSPHPSSSPSLATPRSAL